MAPSNPTVTKADEWLNGGIKGGYSTVLLQAGYYRVAIAHRENNRNSRLDARFKCPPGAGPQTRTRIHPVAPEQDGLCGAIPPFDLNTPGEVKVTYSATDSAGNTATAVRTIILENNADAPYPEAS